ALAPQPCCVLARGPGVVDRTGPDHHHQAVVHAVQHPMDRLARLVGRVGGALADRKLAQQVRGRREFLDLADAQVGGGVGHGRLIFWGAEKKTAGRSRRSHRIRFGASGLRTRSRLVPPAAGKAEEVKVKRDAVQHFFSVRPDRRRRKSGTPAVSPSPNPRSRQAPRRERYLSDRSTRESGAGVALDGSAGASGGAAARAAAGASTGAAAGAAAGAATESPGEAPAGCAGRVPDPAPAVPPPPRRGATMNSRSPGILPLLSSQSFACWARSLARRVRSASVASMCASIMRSISARGCDLTRPIA